jgi:hypothetical protein
MGKPKTHFTLAGGTPEQWLKYLDQRIAVLEAREEKKRKRRGVMEKAANILAIAALSLGMYLWLTDSWWSAGFCFTLAIIGRCGALCYKGLEQ